MIEYRVLPRLYVVNKALYEQERLGCGWCRHPCHTHTFKGCHSPFVGHPRLSPGVITRGALASALKVAEDFWRAEETRDGKRQGAGGEPRLKEDRRL